MPCRSEIREIHERSYTVTQMPPTVSIPIQMKLVQMASSVAGPMLQDSLTGGSDSAGIDAIGKAFGAVGEAISKHMPPDEFLAFAKKLTASDYVRAEGGPIDFESEFCGDDMVRLYPLLAFILEVNYAQFFRGLGLNKAVDLAKARFQATDSSESPPT